MAVKPRIELDIVPRDTTGGAIAALNKRLSAINAQAAYAREPFERLARNASTFHKLSGLGTIAGGLGSVARTGYAAFTSAMRVIEPLAAITSAASLAGMVQLALAWSNVGVRLGQVAARAGLSAQQLSGLENAAQLAGVETGSMSSGLVSLKDNLTNAASGRAPQVVGMFQALGVSFRDASGHMRGTTELLPELADRIASLHDPTLQAETATTLFGGAGEALLPFLRRGSAGIAEYTEKARRYGLMNDDAVAAAGRLREAQTSLMLSVQGLGNAVAEKLAPVIGPLLTQLADWIARNREWIASGIGDAVGRFAGYLQAVEWPAVGQRIEGIWHAADGVAQALGGWMPVAKGLLAFLVGKWLVQMMLTIGRVSKALGGIGGGGIVGKLGAGLVAHEALQMLDPQDSTGIWIDQNVPGAAFLDNLASKVGAGRSYQQQAEAANPSSRGGPVGTAPANGAPVVTAGNLAADHAMSPQKRALLDTIAGPESHGDYSIINGGRHFSDMSQHPNWLNPASNSTAAGRYQLIGSTFDAGARLAGVHDFTPASQDRAAWALASNKYRRASGGGDLEADLLDPSKRPQVQRALGGSDLWTSLNMGGFDAALARERASPDAPSGPTASLPPDAGTSRSPGGSGAATDGRLQVGVTVDGPAGTTTRVSQAGDGLEPVELRRRTPVGAAN